MKWQDRRRSSNIEDRRGQASGRTGGGINPMLLAPLIRFFFTKKGLIVLGIGILLLWVTGINPLQLLGFLDGSAVQTKQQSYTASPEEERLAAFSATILADTEDIWNKLLSNYREPTLVLYNRSVQSACGMASSATGPFYCPADEKLYLDLSFFDDMEKQLNAPGDFAQAYVIAHEVGHHVQNLTGVLQKLHSLSGQVSQTEFNKYSVMVELQADFYAGVWAHHSQRMSNMMEVGDLEEAINAANAIGDDRLQKQATGHVTPDSFTHGTSKQRVYWFRKGYQTGDLAQGDTYSD